MTGIESEGLANELSGIEQGSFMVDVNETLGRLTEQDLLANVQNMVEVLLTFGFCKTNFIHESSFIIGWLNTAFSFS